eukprot:Phypoly_transcript_07797.p1 GENE.Phypoly_transcript_07797~~Phypoly_transcript_07797.p1  ORF type:complete len:518 (+),score=142.47 Phypoly_transcript_07797:96-1556(+)
MSNNKHPSYSSFQNATPHHANNDDEEDENEMTPQQIERIYSQLSTHVHPLEKKSGTYAQIAKYSQNVPMDKEYFVDVKDVFTAINLDSNKAQSNNGEKRLLLWFGTRLSSIAAILIRGLRPTVNHITEWRNLTLYDIVLPAAEKAYLFSNKKGFIKNKGVLMLCEVAYTDILELESSDLMTDLPPPTDGTILKLCGKYFPEPSSNGTLGGVDYPNGKIKRNDNTDVVPCGNYNQYLVADTTQIRIKYIITAECRTNNTTLKPTKDFMTIPANTTTQTSKKTNISSYFTKAPTNSSEKGENGEKSEKSEKGEKRKRDSDDSDEDLSEKAKKIDDGKGKKKMPLPSPPPSPPHTTTSSRDSSPYSSPPSSPSPSPSPSFASPSSSFVSSSSSFSPPPSSSKPTASASSTPSPTSKKEVKKKIWQYFTHGGWKDFADEHNETVNENSEKNKRKFEVHIGSTSYTIDTANSVQYQTNDPTKRRKIRVKPK